MSCRVLESCIGCDMCVLECPNDAITEKDGVYTINEDLCTECVGFYKSRSA